MVQVQDKSPASKAVVRLRCELIGTNNEAHIMLVNNGATKNLIKSIGRLELTERIKGNSGKDFFPVDTLFSQTLKVEGNNEPLEFLPILCPPCQQLRLFLSL